MQIFLYLLYGITFVIAALLILVILIQRSKSGGGLGGLATTSSGVEDAFGSDAGNVLVKVTWFLGALFLAVTISIGLLQGFIAQHEDRDMAGMSSSETGKKKDATLTGDSAKTEEKAGEKTGDSAKTEEKAGEKTGDSAKTEEKKAEEPPKPSDK